MRFFDRTQVISEEVKDIRGRNTRLYRNELLSSYWLLDIYGNLPCGASSGLRCSPRFIETPFNVAIEIFNILLTKGALIE